MPATPYAQAPAPASNGMAVAALVVGIISLAGFLCVGVGGVVLGPIAVLLGILGLRRANALPGTPQKGVAIAGIVTGAIGLLIGLAVVALFVLGASVDDGYNSDPSDGTCDFSRTFQDPDC